MTGRYAEGSRKGAGGRKPKYDQPTTVLRLPLPVANLARRIAEGTLRGGDVAAFLDVQARTAEAVPLFASHVPCGFPSPADDYLDRALDFNELLIANPAATFVVRVQGESMTGDGIFPGDLAVIDRSLTPFNGCVVLALIDGAFTIKRYRLTGGSIILEAANPAFQPLTIGPETGLEVWGVVKHSIRVL